MSKGMRKQNARSPNHKRREEEEEDTNNLYGVQIKRTVEILIRLAKGPQTTDGLARHYKTSPRTINRMMRVISERAPVYRRRRSGTEPEWNLDVPEWLELFQK